MKNLPALKAALFLSLGTVIGHVWKIPFGLIYILSAGMLLSSIFLFIFRRNTNLLQLTAAGLLIWTGITGIRYREHIRPPNHISRFSDIESSVGLKAHLVKDPVEKSGRIELIVRADTLFTGKKGYSVSGKIRVPIHEPFPHPLIYGDGISVRGLLEKPAGLRNPGGFDYRAYLRRRGIECILRLDSKDPIEKTGPVRGNLLLRKVVYPVRRFMLRTIDRTAEGQERAILRALLVGEKGLLTSETQDRFAQAGIIHVLAVSGLHVGYIFLIFTFMLGLFRIPSWTKGILILAGLFLYVLLTEAHPPVMRASIMAAALLIGSLLERNIRPLNLLGFAAFILLLVRPMDLFDTGFQLSFTAVFSILYFYPALEKLPLTQKIRNRLQSMPLGNQIASLLLVSCSAYIGTLPLSIAYFNRVPLFSIWVNLLAIPWIGIIVALGFCTILISALSPWIGSVYGLLNQTLLSIFRHLMSGIGSLPFSHINCPAPSIFLVIAYYSLILFILQLREPKRRKIFIFIFMIAANGFVWERVIRNNAGKLTWIQFDVGQGDAALLRFPRGRTLLVDGGQKSPYFDAGDRIIAPYLRKKGIRKLNGIILTHPHNDHVGGLVAIVNEFHVGQIITAGSECDSRLYRQFIEAAEKRKVPVSARSAPDSICSFPGAEIIILSPPSGYEKMNAFQTLNNQSLSIRIRYGRNCFLLMGDAEEQAEKELLKQPQPLTCDILKAGHHGSLTSSSQPFILSVSPSRVIISVGKNNRFRHPSPNVLARFEAMGIEVLRTDRQGALIYQSDGQTLKQVHWRKNPWVLP